LTATITASKDKNNFGVEASKDFGSNAITASAAVAG